jgi:large subunit ribosomal protein L18
MKSTITRRSERRRRHQSIRKKLTGTKERPRLSVFRSHQHVYAQVIDDEAGHTLASASTVDKDVRTQLEYGGNIDAAVVVGEHLAKRAKEKGIERVVFDRGGNLYHGRVKALADAAREHGLEF